MFKPQLITSNQNPKIKSAAKLSDRRERDQTGLFLIEGYRELKRAADAGVAIESLFICPKLFLGENEPALIADIAKRGADIFECPPELFQKLSYRDRPDGLIAVAVQMKLSLEKISADAASLFVIAEAIEKPGNLGTIIRTADAVGATAVIVCDRCTDIYNPNVVRASVGTLFTLPVLEADGQAVLEWLRQNKVKIIAATPHAKEVFTDIDMSGPVAIAMGTEQLGLSELWMKSCDIPVRIPMHGVADSLNVAMATTLLLYEVVRQRGAGCGSYLRR